MKKNVLQRVFALTLAGAMVAGTLTACGNSDEPAGSDSTVGSDASTGTEASTDDGAADAETPADSGDSGSAADSGAAGMDGWEAFAENVTLQIPVYDRGDAGNGCSDVANNYWTAWVQQNFGDKYNITVEFVPITRTAVMADYAMLAAGQDLPTICMEYDYDKLATWQGEGYLQPYDVEQFKTIAPTYWANMEANGLDAYTKLADEDYLLLGQRPYGNTNYTFIRWYREDWLKEAGFTEYPKTYSELYELCGKLVENGHEAPLGGYKVIGAGVDLNHAFRDYPQDEVEWVTTGDFQVPAMSSTANKRFLKWENALYNAGYKDPEYYLKEQADMEADFINGKCFIYDAYVSSSMNVLNSFYEANPDGDLGIVVCDKEPNYDETWEGYMNSFRPNNLFGAMVAFANDATEDEMKAAMMYMEWMSQEDVLFTMTWGEEGINYTVGEDGNPVAVGDQAGIEQQQGHNNNVDYWMIVTASKTFGSIEKDIAAITPQGIPEDFYQDLLDNYYGQLALYEAGYATPDCLFATAIESANEEGTTLKEDKYPEFRDRVVMCSPEEFDALYDELSQEYLEAGYQAIIDERKAAYDEGLTTHLE